MPAACRLRSFFVALLLLAGCVPAKQTTPTAPPQRTPAPAPSVQPLPPPAPAGPRQVALLLPLTGPAGTLGRDLLDAASMALFDEPSGELVLVPRDTGSSAETARAAAREVLAQGAELVLGPLFAAATSAVAPLARERRVPVLSFSNDSSIAAPDVFVLGWRPEEQVVAILRHALDQGWRRLGLLAPDDGYGALVAAAWRSELAARGEPAAQAVALYPASGDPAPVVRAFLERYGGRTASGADRPPAFDALMIADGGLRLRQIAALLAFYDIDPSVTRLLGTRLWADDPAVLRDSALRGGRLAAPDPAAEAAFRRRFAAVFGREPQRLAELAYDATRLAAIATAGGRPLELATLLDPRGFQGTLGPFRLRADGLVEHALAILELDGEGLRVIEPAPTRFPSPLAAR
ncbi:MAG: penicillin-binding protein activator [Geminicoccaceae bacterium]|nr:penicillin-binding protein activator [Geminicoccaceae bacterium]